MLFLSKQGQTSTFISHFSVHILQHKVKAEHLLHLVEGFAHPPSI